MEIELADGTILDAPDDADPSAVAKAYMAKQKPINDNPASDPSLYDKDNEMSNSLMRGGKDVARAVGLAGRTILNTAASAPLAAMDAGVAGRNYLAQKMKPKSLTDLIAPQQAPQYELPSKTWNDALNASGVPQFQGPIEKGGDIAGQMLLSSKLPTPQASTMAPANFARPLSVRDATLAASQKEGYVVPPSTTNPSLLNKILESIGGKVATAQDASLKNAGVTEKLATRALGMKAGSQIAEDTLPAIRAEAAKAYAPLRGIGMMRADSEYAKQLADIAKPFENANKSFPGLAGNDVLDMVKTVNQKSFDSDAAVDAISLLREKATTAYSQGDKTLGKAYRGITDAMENAIERSLARRGASAQDILAQFRAARQQIAKTYSVEGALNKATGQVSATKLATQLAKGKPLSGDLKTIAKFGSAFPKAAQAVTDSGSVRNTDVMMGAGTAALSKEPSYLLYPFLRQAVRKGLLSDTGQALTREGLPADYPQTAMQLLYGANGLFQQ